MSGSAGMQAWGASGALPQTLISQLMPEPLLVTVLAKHVDELVGAASNA